MFLTEDRIKLLCKLKMSGFEKTYVSGNFRTEVWYTDGDAEKYFEWLVAVANETEDVDVAVVKQAYDQLFRFLYVMRDDIDRAKNVEFIAPYDWQNLFLSFDKDLVDIKNIVDRHDKSIVDVLKLLVELVEKNKTLLEKIVNENEELFGENAHP